LLITSGKAYKKKHWCKSGDDHLAAYDKGLVVWVSERDTVSVHMADKREALLTSKDVKDRPAQNSRGHEDEYWADTEAGLLNIPKFKGIIYVTDGSQSSEGMASTGTTPVQVAAAESETVTRGNRQTGQSTQQLRWPWRTH